MADNNPIKYSDLIQADDSISRLIKELDEANDAYSNLANSIKTQAAGIKTSLAGVNSATQSGRGATKGYSQDVEKLLKAQRDLTFARSEAARKIAELNAMKKDEQTITKLTIQLNRTQEGSYEHLAAQYGLNKIRLNAMTAEYRANTKEGQKLETETREIYEEMKRLQEATGKHALNVGNYQGAIDSLIGTQGRWFAQLQNLGTVFSGGVANGIKMAGQQVAVFGKQLLALLANPIVAMIAAVAAAFMALQKGITSSEENTRSLARILAPFERILTEVTDVLQVMAGFLLKGVEGLENMAMAASRFAERLPVVGKYLKQVNNALEENVRLTREKQELEDLERTYSVQNAAMARNSAKWRAEAEKTSDPKRRAQLFKMAARAEEQAMYNELQLAREDLRIKEALAAQAGNDKKTNDELAQARARLYQVEERYYQRQVRLNSKLRKENEKAQKGAGGKSDSKSQTDETQKIADAKLAIERKTEELRISMIEDSFSREASIINNKYDTEIEDLRIKGEKETALREQINEQITALDTKRHMELSALVTKYAEKEQAANDKLTQQKKKAADDVYKIQVDALDKQTDLKLLEIDNMQTSEYEKTQLRIQAEKDRLKKIYDLNVQAGKDINSLEMKILQEQIKGMDNTLAKNKKHRDMYDMLGLKLDDDKKEAISQSFAFATEQLANYMDAWVQAAEAKTQLAEKDVEAAQSTLDAEIEARNQGYASDVEGARKELELAKKTHEQALKEQEKAQKAQEALQTVQQIGNLVSATALIWSQLGFPWAIPAIAVMWGSFAAAKIKAASVTKSQTEQYGEGTVELLEGGSHQSGNDIDLGRKPNGTRRRAEGGEFFAVINKRNSRRYRQYIPDVINSLNNGTFGDKYLHAYDGAQGMLVNVQSESPDLRRLSDDVHVIREQGVRQTYNDERGTHLFYKNLHRIIKS